MARFRRDALPLDGRESLELVDGERVLGWARGPGEVAGAAVFVVATDRAVHIPAPAGLGRTPWDLVVRAAWEDPVLEVVAQEAPGSRPRTIRVVLDEPRDLVSVVHAQVTGSVMVQQRLDLGEGRYATAVARRVADTGKTRWSVSFDRGDDPRDPELRAAADAALRDLRAALGI